MQASAAEWRAWREAAALPEVERALLAVYAEIGEAVDARQPVCEASGRCCRFEAYGHDLFVTGLEVAWFVDRAGSPPADGAGDGSGVSLPVLGASPPESCPYQVGGLCSVREFRPMGCRVFFCEAGTEDWQATLTERGLRALRGLHDRLELPYRYMEWRRGLAEALDTGTWPH